MQVKFLALCLAGLLPLLTNSMALAQVSDASKSSVAPKLSTGSAEDPVVEEAYSLKGGALGTAGQQSDQGAAVSYQQGSTGSTSGRSASAPIMTAPAPAKGAPLKTESGIWFYPSVTVAAGNNDNLLSEPTNPKRSSYANLATEIVAELKRGGDRYTAKLDANISRYAQSRDDDFSNYNLRFAGDHHFSLRSRLGWAIGQTVSTDPRGSTQRAISNSPDHWTMPTVEGIYIYGAPSASGRVEVDAKIQSKHYDNNRATTATAEYDRTEVGGRFFMRTGSRSHAFAEIRSANNDYKSSLSTSSNTERRYYLGLTWEATAATTGNVKVGRMSKDFDQPGLPDPSSSSWSGNISWMPLTYSTVNLGMSQEIVDPTGLGNSVLNTSTNLAWTHKWSTYINSSLSAGRVRSSFASTTRVDDTDSYSAKVGYDLLRWMTIAIDYARTERTSTDSTANFKRNVIMLTLNATL